MCPRFLLLAPLLACTALAAQTVPAPPLVQESQPLEGRKNQRVEHIHLEDSGAKIDEIRYGGQTQSITVQPKANVPEYEIQPTDPSDWLIVAGEVRQPMTDEEMQQSWKQLHALEEEMRSTGAWVFSGRLPGPDTATVVRISGGEVLTTDGPFVEAKEHLGGFYIIQAADLDAALAWASKVTAAIKVPIEVRPFAGFEA